MLEVVIFDLDGLLIDSEPLQFEAYRAAFSKYGATLELSDWPEWHKLEASAARWIDAHKLGLDSERIRADKKLLYDELILDRLTLKPGARDLVASLSNRFRLCIASGSRMESIEACLGKFSLAPYFEKLFSATILRRKKPYPDVYLEAISGMQVSPRRALVIEDSVTGLQAAISAGIKCVVCPDNFLPAPMDAYAGATLVVNSLEELTVSDVERLADESTGT